MLTGFQPRQTRTPGTATNGGRVGYFKRGDKDNERAFFQAVVARRGAGIVVGRNCLRTSLPSLRPLLHGLSPLGQRRSRVLPALGRRNTSRSASGFPQASSRGTERILDVAAQSRRPRSRPSLAATTNKERPSAAERSESLICCSDPGPKAAKFGKSFVAFLFFQRFNRVLNDGHPPAAIQ